MTRRICAGGRTTTEQDAKRAPSERSQAARRAAVPRLLQRRRRRPLWRRPTAEVGSGHPGRAQVHSCCSPGRRIDPHHLGRPVRPPWRDRGVLRSAAHVHRRRVEPGQPPIPDRGHPGRPAVAQRQRPAPRRPRRATPRTRPHPLPRPTTMESTHRTNSSLTNAVNVLVRSVGLTSRGVGRPDNVGLTGSARIRS